MSDLPSSFLYQASSDTALKAHFLNQDIEDVQAPAAVIDAAVVKRNCRLMLSSAQALKVSFRAHVKTHKTVQLAKLQVGEGPVRLIVSTIAELEHLIPWLLECIENDRIVDVLYGVPASPSSLPRLAKIAKILGKSEYLSLMVDHADTLDFIIQSHGLWSGTIRIFIKIDTGYHRSGIEARSTQLRKICEKLERPESERTYQLVGLYSHLGNSYGYSSPNEAVQGLFNEFNELTSVLDTHNLGSSGLTLSVGATPTTTAAQLLGSSDSTPEVSACSQLIQTLRNKGYNPELHAGVYPVLDLQQLATHARPSNLSYSNIGLRMLVEVASLYPEREKPEALIAAGSLVLGREPCKSYPGWGIVSPWPHSDCEAHYREEVRTGWIVGRVSQEHGILTWKGSLEGMRKLKIGEKLLVWPNHACIAGAGFGWYLVVDSEGEEPNKVVDVWVRCRGW